MYISYYKNSMQKGKISTLLFFFSLFFLYFKIMRAVLVKQPGKDITDIKYIPVDASCHLR